jgi:hypothetical protein
VAVLYRDFVRGGQVKQSNQAVDASENQAVDARENQAVDASENHRILLCPLRSGSLPLVLQK